MDFTKKKFSIEKALFRLDNEFEESVPFKLYKFATDKDFKRACRILIKKKIRFIKRDGLVLEILGCNENSNLERRISRIFKVNFNGTRECNNKGRSFIVFKSYSFRKDKNYIFKKRNYTCQTCGMKAPVITIGPLKIQDWEVPYTIPLGLDVHVAKCGNRVLAFVMCDKCHFSFHYYTKLTDEALKNWKRING